MLLPLCLALLAGGGLAGDDAASLLQAQGRPRYYWAGKNGDALRTGLSGEVAPSAIAGGPTWSFHEKWPKEAFREYPSLAATFGTNLHGLVRSAPLIDDQKNVYLTTVTFGNIYKFDMHGKMLWHHNAGPRRQIPDIPALMDGRLFASTDRAEVFAVDMETGAVKWKTQVANRSAGDTWSIAAADGIVVSAFADDWRENNNRLVGLRAEDGQRLWDFEAYGDIYNILVAIKDGSCVLSTSAGKIYRLDLHTGRTIWETEMPQRPSFSTGGSMIGSDGVVYSTWNEGFVGGVDGFDWGHGKLTATDLATGRRLWQTDLVLGANNAPSVGPLADGRLGVFVAVGPNPDKPNRTAGILDGAGGPPKQQRILALDAQTGTMSWRYDLPDWYGSALGDAKRPDICLPDSFGNVAVGGDGTVYVGHASGFLYAVKDKDGNGKISTEEVSKWQTGAAFQGTPAIAPGMLAATPCDGLHVWLTK